MPVVPLTLTISLCLAFTFVIFFLREHARGRVSSAERDSLLPFAEETPRRARATAPRDRAAQAAALRLVRQSSLSDGESFGDEGGGGEEGMLPPGPGGLRRE